MALSTVPSKARKRFEPLNLRWFGVTSEGFLDLQVFVLCLKLLTFALFEILHHKVKNVIRLSKHYSAVLIA